MSMGKGVFDVTRRPPGSRRIDIGGLSEPLGLMVATSNAGMPPCCAVRIAQQASTVIAASVTFMPVTLQTAALLFPFDGHSKTVT